MDKFKELQSPKVISLGYRCPTAKALKNLGYRTQSYPLDWAVTLSLSTINSILQDDNVCTDYLDDVIDYTSPKIRNVFGARVTLSNIMYTSKKYPGLIFRHFDFINKPKEREKELRRIKRFIELLKSDRKIIFVRMCQTSPRAQTTTRMGAAVPPVFIRKLAKAGIKLPVNCRLSDTKVAAKYITNTNTIMTNNFKPLLKALL